MSRRYQVFVSSTYEDLIEERLEVIKAILELDGIPSGMEYFPAASEESWSYIKDLIEESDYYVLIVGGRYGSLTPEGISYTQKEYEYALSVGIPTIAFFHANPEDITAGKTERTEAGKKQLAAFLGLVKRNLCKEWTNPDQLGAVVSRSLTQLIRRFPRVGWVRADSLAATEATQQILDLTNRVKELEGELATLRGTVSSAVDGLAQDDDLYNVEFSYSVVFEGKRRYDVPTIVGSYKTVVVASWNEIFAKLGPLMLLKCSEAQVKNGLSRLCELNWDWDYPRKAEKAAVKGLTVTEDAYQTVRLQLVALGFALLSKELVNEKHVTVWSLTKRGEEKLMSIRAIRREL